MGSKVWAFSIADHRGTDFFNVLTETALPDMNDLKNQELSSMLWCLAISGSVKEAFLTASLDAFHMMDLGPQQLANIVWAFAKALLNHSMTYAAVVHLLPRIAAELRDFKMQEVTSVLHALAKVVAMDCEGATVLNRAWLLLPPVYQSIDAFMHFAVPWIREHQSTTEESKVENTFESIFVAELLTGWVLICVLLP